jgi:transcriptional regulator with XRE-family HTH domain
MLTIGERIKTLRVLHSLTQEQFAKAIDVSRRQVTYWETGHDAPSAQRIPQICQALHVSADWLLTGRAQLNTAYDSSSVMRPHDELTLRRFKNAITLLNRLPHPEEWESRSGKAETLPALPEDAGAFAIRLPDDSFAPKYCSGDLLYFRPLKISLPAPIEIIVPLDGHDVAFSLNGESSIRRFNIQPSGKKSHTVQLTSIGKKPTRFLLRPDDSMAIHGVAYKSVRAL